MTVTRDEVLLTAPRLYAGGTELPDLWLSQLVEVRVQQGLRAIGRATLTFDDPEYTLGKTSTLKVGTAAHIEAADSSGTLLIRGTVTAVERELTPRHGARLVVTVDDKAYDLTRAAIAKSYHQMSLSDILTLITQPLTMTFHAEGLPATQLPFTMRSDSGLGLVDELCVRYGCDWLIDDAKLSIWPAATGNLAGAPLVTLSTERDLHALSVRQVSDAPTTVTVRGWDATTKSAVTATATSPTARAGIAPTNRSGAKFERESSRSAVSTVEEAALVAKGLAARTGRMVARGSALFTPTLRPGGTVKIEGAGPSNGSYYVREVTHVVDTSGARTSFVAGDRDPVLLSDPWDEPATLSSFRRSGLAVAIVDGLDDPAAVGRVSVQLPTASGQSKSAWARLLQLGAGEARGHLFMPDVGDEVLIGFEDDDVARPVVLGGLFGGRSKPHRASVKNGAVVAQAIQTKTGHLLEFSEGEAPAEQHILISAAGGTQKLRLGKDTVRLEADAGVPLTIKVGTSSIEFDGNGAITIDATTITLKGKTKVAIESTAVDVAAKSGLTLEGLTTSLKAKASGSVEASGVQEIKGSLVKIN